MLLIRVVSICLKLKIRSNTAREVRSSQRFLSNMPKLVVAKLKSSEQSGKFMEVRSRRSTSCSPLATSSWFWLELNKLVLIRILTFFPFGLVVDLIVSKIAILLFRFLYWSYLTVSEMYPALLTLLHWHIEFFKLVLGLVMLQELNLIVSNWIRLYTGSLKCMSK